MKHLRQWGGAGEDLARAYLLEKGYQWLASNYLTRWGEIDLVMMDGDVVVFVEVKRRKSRNYGTPEEAVSSLKQYRMAKVALMFIQGRRLDGKMVRFDAVALDDDGIRHVRDAFSVDGSFYY